jgi:hypothetical protein
MTDYQYMVKFALPGGATQIMYFTSSTKSNVSAIAHDIQAINYSIQTL